MKYLPIIKQIDDLVGNSAIGHVLLFKTMEYLLPRTWHLKRELSKWERRHDSHKHILDAGSGLGQYSYLLTKMNEKWSILGADVNDRQVSHCNSVFRKMKLNNVLFRSQDLLYDLKPSEYDLVLATDLAEYVEDDKELFAQFFQSLKSTGMLLMYSHLRDETNPDRKRVRMKLVEEQFRNGYSAKGIKEKLKGAGFEKVKVRLVFGLAGRISWYTSVFYPLKMLNASFAFVALLPFYYLLTLPVTLTLNYLDSRTAHLSGTAMMITAVKP